MPERHARPDGASSLLELLKARIAAEGPLTIADYMEACLGHAEYGYYATRDPLGEAGDFITAPEISQVFGELIGLWCAVVWQQMGAPRPIKLVELGPGRGTFMADALRAVQSVPAFAEAIDLHLVETSPVLRGIQQDTLAPARPEIAWHDRLEDVPEGASIVVANEFLDALPVQQFQFTNGAWFERHVGVSDGGDLEFCLTSSPLPDPVVIPAGIREAAREEDFAEIRPLCAEIVAEISRRSEKTATAALFIDYGHVKSAPGESLQAVKGHDYADPLADAGNADLTAHVDFEQLGRAAREARLAVHGPMTQGAFLMSLGLMQRCDRLLATAKDDEAQKIVSGAQRLADTTQMGELFKVMVLTSRGIIPPPFDAAPAGNTEQ